MTAREWMLAGFLAVAGALIAAGAFSYDRTAGYIVSGLLVASWAWLVFADDGRPRP